MNPDNATMTVEPLSKEFLLARGTCCHNGCVNCPWNFDVMDDVDKQIIQHTIEASRKQYEQSHKH